MRKWIDIVISSMAAFLVLVLFAHKTQQFFAGEWLRAGGAMVFYLLQFSLFIGRARSHTTLDHPCHYGVALCGTCLPFLLQLKTQTPAWLTWGSIPLELIGMGFSIVALFNLGRGFGVFAANRTIKTHGLYRYIRHPLYAGEALLFFSLVLQNASVFNGLLFGVHQACQIKRIFDEEQLLRQDPIYQQYYEQVRYRMLPGLF